GIAQSGGSGASSATWTKASSDIFPFLTSGINPLPEWFDTEPLHRIDEQLVGIGAQREVGLNNILDHISDFGIGHRRPDQASELCVLVGAAANRDLIELLAVLLDTENADMADVMMTAGVDAAGNVDVQSPDQIGGIVIGKAPRQFLRNRDRARIGERAVIQPRASDDVGHQIDVGGRKTDLVERFPQRSEEHTS